MADFVTVLATYGPSLTKIYRSDGKTDAYDDAASFQCKELAVTDLSGLSRLLTKLETRTQNCIIRGKYVGDDRAEPGKLEGSIARTNSNFDDCPHHWFMVDIDKYEPDFDDPVNDPVNAIRDYLDRLMPPCFKDASFHWQLSSSAGMPGKTHILKAHVWFWSETPYTSAQMYAWAKQVGIWIDKAVYRRVQIHYTANPVFEAGRDDPVPVRSGFYQGTRDTVALKIDADVLESARQTGSGVGGADKELKDPSLKENIIGAFHQAFDAQTVLMEHLEGLFEPGVNDRRWTWLDGGGTPEGVWVHSDGMHVGATHNTWPAELEGAPNLWDLVRVFKFGHLDHSEDDFAQLDIDEMELHERPSHKAMVAWAKELPEVAEKLAEIEQREAEARSIAVFERLAALRTAVRDATDERALQEVVCAQIRADELIGRSERDSLVEAVVARFRALGATRSKATVRRLVAPAPVIDASDGLPRWLQGWYYVTEQDKFYRHDTEEWLTQQGFNARFNREIPHSEDRPSAYTVALEFHRIPVVTRALYLPTWPLKAGRTNDGQTAVNTYRPSSVPVAAAKLDGSSRRAIKLVQDHIGYLCNGRPHLIQAVMDFLAHNVQYPGEKIRYAILWKGIEGDGKSLLGTIMGHVMGGANVKMISPKAIASDFNGWAEGSCLGVLEEIRMVGHNRHDILNAVKPCITNDIIPVHRKGRDEYNCPNVTNYLAFTNHSDALPLEDTDRRWLIIFTPWNSPEEMSEIIGVSLREYFDALHNAIQKHADALRRWLLDWDISGSFDRNGRAPETEEKKVMISLGVSDEEAIARDIIQRGTTGVSERIVSTSDLAMAMLGHQIPAPKGRAMNSLMLRLGYTRVEKPINWTGHDGKTRRIWIKDRVVPDTATLHIWLNETIDYAEEFQS